MSKRPSSALSGVRSIFDDMPAPTSKCRLVKDWVEVADVVAWTIGGPPTIIRVSWPERYDPPPDEIDPSTGDGLYYRPPEVGLTATAVIRGQRMKLEFHEGMMAYLEDRDLTLIFCSWEGADITEETVSSWLKTHYPS